jgi:hypothetical protein
MSSDYAAFERITGFEIDFWYFYELHVCISLADGPLHGTSLSSVLWKAVSPSYFSSKSSLKHFEEIY